MPLKTAADGVLYGVSDVLGLRVCLDGDRLRYWDPKTGEYLPTSTDKDRQLAEKDRINANQAQALEAARAEIDALRRRLANR